MLSKALPCIIAASTPVIGRKKIQLAISKKTRTVVTRDIQEPRILAGGHVRGGIKGAVKHALEIGAGPMQIFIGSPQTWIAPEPGATDISDFKKAVIEHQLGPVFVHGCYLVNLAASSIDNLKKSIENLYLGLRYADAIGAAGLIFHPGSAGKGDESEAIEKVVKSLEIVLHEYSGNCRLLLEVCAGQGGTIGNRFDQLGRILNAMGNDKRLGICWDTCHLYSAGYDIATEDGLERTMDEFHRTVGFEWLLAIHANDSKTPLGSRKDRHENIGQGHIGEAAFARMLCTPSLRSLPWILEVPGYENKGPDRKSIELLHRLSRQ